MMAPAATNLGFDLHILAESPTVGAVAGTLLGRRLFAKHFSRIVG